MKIFLSLLCLFATASAQMPAATQHIPFSAQLYNTASPDSSKSRLLVSLALLHDELSFAKTDSGFGAEYELALEITNDGGDWAAGREEKRRIHVRTFAETNSRQKYSSQDYHFDLAPGKYRASFTFVDRVSGATARSEFAKELRAFSAKSKLALSDMILLDRVETDSLNRMVIAPDLYENTTAPEGELHLYLEMFAPNLSASLSVQQTIRNWKGEAVVEQKRDWPRRAKLEHALLPIWIDALPYGAYEIEMKVRHGKTEKTVREKFHLTWNGVPQNGLHLDQALRLAQYIADEDERAFLQTAARDFSKEQKREALLRFWERRDESPITPENEAMNTYYQRVEAANAKFSAGRQEGRLTDFGKIFVTFGAPDSVELFNGNSPASLIQVWHYRRIDRRFSFLDLHGTGDFRLMPR